MKLRVFYPWERTPVGGYFFVPTLTPERTREEGLRVALYVNCRGRGTPGVLHKRFGVLFQRTH